MQSIASVSGRLRARTGMLVMAGVCLLGATPASAAVGIAISSGRLWAIVAAVVGLTGVIFGWRALARSGHARRGAVVALAGGLIGMALSGLHLALSDGAIGTGNGRGGAIVALVVGLIGTVLGGLALVRSRRTLT